MIPLRKPLISLVVAIYLIRGFGVNAQEEPPPSEKTLSRYNITACEHPKFVWFRVAKAGTRSILFLLSENFQFSINDYNIPFDPDHYEDYFKFAFVRNPWDRVVSCYCNKVLTKIHAPFQECYDKSFDYFVDFINRQNLLRGDVHIRLQTQLFPMNELHFIGQLENFDDDLRYILSVLGVNDVNIPRRNTSKHEHYSRYYTERTKNVIARKYKKDIEAFGYEFETQ